MIEPPGEKAALMIDALLEQFRKMGLSRETSAFSLLIGGLIGLELINKPDNMTTEEDVRRELNSILIVLRTHKTLWEEQIDHNGNQ